MTAQWYAIYSRPMKEAFLCEQLSLHQIESYCPYIRLQPVNPRARKVQPYFPRYVFCHLDLEQTNVSTLLWIPGSSGIVSFDRIPAHVPDNLIVAIQRRVAEINAAGGELRDTFKPGDVLTVRDGPFKGYEAIFDARLSGEERVRVLLNFMSRPQVRLELQSVQIARQKQ